MAISPVVTEIGFVILVLIVFALAIYFVFLLLPYFFGGDNNQKSGTTSSGKPKTGDTDLPQNGSSKPRNKQPHKAPNHLPQLVNKPEMTKLKENSSSFDTHQTQVSTDDGPSPKDDAPPLHIPLGEYDAICPPPFVYSHPNKGEDKSFSGRISDRWPTIIVADGATGSLDENNEVVEGRGKEAASSIVEHVREQLNQKFGNKVTLPKALTYLQKVYDTAAEDLKSKNIYGSTTLLISILFQPSDDDTLVWLYAFVGDGAIVLFNPDRDINGRVIPSKVSTPNSSRHRVSTPQKSGDTAVISGRGVTLPPIVGCIAYQPDDVVYVASDGMDLVEKDIMQNKRIYLANYIHQTCGANLDFASLYAELNKFKFGDDATLGLIWTRRK